MLCSFVRISTISLAYLCTARELGLLWYVEHTQPPLKNVWRFWNAPPPGNRIPRLRLRSTARSGLSASGAALGNARDEPVWLRRSADHRLARSARAHLRSVMPFSRCAAAIPVGEQIPFWPNY